jgi:hypothetical protein
MRIRVKFGSDHEEGVDWHKDMNDFPKLLVYKDKKYGWVFYDFEKPGTGFYMTFLFSEVPIHDPEFYIDGVKWENLFNREEPTCHCGAKYSSFAWDHMRMCKLWKPWNSL